MRAIRRPSLLSPLCWRLLVLLVPATALAVTIIPALSVLSIPLLAGRIVKRTAAASAGAVPTTTTTTTKTTTAAFSYKTAFIHGQRGGNRRTSQQQQENRYVSTLTTCSLLKSRGGGGGGEGTNQIHNSHQNNNNNSNSYGSGLAKRVCCLSSSSNNNDSDRKAELMVPAPSTASTIMSTNDENDEKAIADEIDPYIWLEDVESEESLTFARAANEACLAALGNPETRPEPAGTELSSVGANYDDNDANNRNSSSGNKNTYQRILAVLESDDRIPHVRQMGIDPATGDGIWFNFWKDATNPKGLWRKTSATSYSQQSPSKATEWTTVLDVDALAARDDVSWVWGGSQPLPRARDTAPESTHQVTRALLSLSRGGSDAVHVKEFDLLTGDFVSDQPFLVPEAKTRASYKSRDVLLVGTDFGPDSLTDSGYPRTVREWVRGTPLSDAPIILEGDKQDVSVSAYIVDERTWGGPIYEVHSRSLTFYTSKYWIRTLAPEHLLAPTDPARNGIDPPPPLAMVDIPVDADLGFVGNRLLISLRSDWQPVPPSGPTYKSGSVLHVDAASLLDHGAAGGRDYQVLFAPTDRTAYESYTMTKNYLILATMDNVKSKLDFYRIGDGGNTLTLVEGYQAEPQIRDCSVQPIDPYLGSDSFWFTTSNFLTPSTLFLADAALVETEPLRTTAMTTDPFIVKPLKSLPPQYESGGLTVAQQMATSKDGTQIPYFIIHNKDLDLNGRNPTLLYGYGGFEISLGPHYIATAGLAWLERGGVYVEANIRGGGEFGPPWHQAGLKANRNKCYEDFIAVAEALIATGVCAAPTLAARGGSNGGLLIGNMYTMRPDLFGALHCAVPLLDMKRYHMLLAGASWMAEYGNPDTDDWEFLQKYSPYHNIDPDKIYPPILLTTSTRDDRVHPGHARKFYKKLMDLSQGKWPVYYYENIEGGHGGAADAKQSAFMTALAYDFMFETLSKNAHNLSRSE